jgi:two-component system, NarL family, invasion response regulator UvrY
MHRILIVADHAIVRAGLKRLLEDEFTALTVGEAGDAAQATVLLEAATWDVVMLDISMPGRSGLELLPEIHSRWPETRVIVLSSFGDQQFAIRALRDGASAFMTKERAPQELLEAIRTVGSGRRYIGNDLAEQLASVVASDRPASPHEMLSKREFEVFRRIAAAQSLSEIAGELGLSSKTVSTYRTRILEKMALRNNAELMQYAIRNGLVA